MNKLCPCLVFSICLRRKPSIFVGFCSLFEKPIIPNHYKEFLKKNSLYISKISTTKFVNELKKIFNNKYFMNSILLLKELEGY